MINRVVRLAAVLALLAGVACIGLRTAEYLAGRFVGEANVMGMQFIVATLPLVPLGILASAVAAVVLWLHPRRSA